MSETKVRESVRCRVECSFWLAVAKSDEVLFSDLAGKVNLAGSIGLLCGLIETNGFRVNLFVDQGLP